jgi:mono/diheme cytochrome c family protein
MPGSGDHLAAPRDRLRRLETRLFIHTPRGWRGHTYVWNEDQTEAHLLRGALERSYEVQTLAGPERRTWYFPSSVDCMACHTKAAGFVLGPKTAQLNLRYDDGHHGHGGGANVDRQQNQILLWQQRSLFVEDPLGQDADTSRKELVSFADWRAVADADEPLSGAPSPRQLARAYLDVNCSICHRPDGIANETSMDLRFEVPLEKMGLLGERVRQGQLSPAGSSRITVGEPELSEILYRMRARGHRQMPPLATHVPDRQALRIIRRWIEDLDVQPKRQ